MGILDDAIKEHLELKRQHGADASELKQLENEAFGAAERPGAEASASDPLAEAPTEFMVQPGAEQEAPVAEASAPTAEQGRPSPRAEIGDLQEAPSTAEESVAEPGPTTEEREAIAEQPTEMYDIEDELASSEAPAPSEEDLVEEEMEEPRLAPVDPLAALEETDGEVEVEAAGAGADEVEDEYEEDDDFWDEKRLSDELDQALEAPSDSEDEEAVFEEAAPPEPAQADEPEPERPRPAGNDEDVLEETPDFLEETPEDDQLWFEQKPPKDFDFDD